MTPIVVVGAGAIGGAVGARLFEAGVDVTLVARGAHADAIAADGLTLVEPDREVTLPVPVVTPGRRRRRSTARPWSRSR